MGYDVSGTGNSLRYTPQALAPTYSQSGYDYSGGFNPSAGESLAGPGMLATSAAFLANPAVGAGLGIINLIGNTYNQIIARREAKRARQEAEKRYQESVAREAQRWNDEMSMAKKRYNLTQAELMQRISEDKKNRAERNEIANYKKAQTYVNRWMGMLNDPRGKQSFLNIMKGGR